MLIVTTSFDEGIRVGVDDGLKLGPDGCIVGCLVGGSAPITKHVKVITELNTTLLY